VGHFHAGFDFGTGRKVGQPVFAPLAGTSSASRLRRGYGRSVYLRTHDGRLIQFGHLDAFAEPMASYVRRIQDSSGVYEQDLWPEASRFPIKLGQRIAGRGERRRRPAHALRDPPRRHGVSTAARRTHR
jgi:hypothetical protein